jgi:hypothetical protein
MRRALTVLATSGLAALSLAACNVPAPGTTPASPTPAASPTVSVADAKETLSKAAMELGKTSYQLTLVAGPISGTGALDSVGRQGQLTLTLFTGSATAEVETVLIDADMWLKLKGVPGVPDKWLHLDTARLPEDSALGIRPGKLDPVNAEKLVDAITSVDSRGSGQFIGKLDLTKVSDSAVVDRATVETLGERATAVPFEATVDAQGRLTNLKLDLGTVDGLPLRVNATYRDFGTRVAPTRPAASDVIEAPAAVYQLLGAGA